MNHLVIFTTVCFCIAFAGVMSQVSGGIPLTFKIPEKDQLLFLFSSVVYYLNETTLLEFHNCLCEMGMDSCKLLTAASTSRDTPMEISTNTAEVRYSTHYSCEARYYQGFGNDFISCTKSQHTPFLSLCNIIMFNSSAYVTNCSSVLQFNFYLQESQFPLDFRCYILQFIATTPPLPTTTKTITTTTTTTTTTTSAGNLTPVPVTPELGLNITPTSTMASNNDTPFTFANTKTRAPATTAAASATVGSNETTVNPETTIFVTEITALTSNKTSTAQTLQLTSPTTTAETARSITSPTTKITSTTPTTKAAYEATQSPVTTTIAASQSSLSTEAESTSKNNKTLSSKEETKGIDVDIIIIAASVGLAVIIALIVIAVLLLRWRKRQKRRKSSYDNDVNDIDIMSNNVSSSTSKSGGYSGHNTHGNTNGSGIEMSSYTYTTVIPSTKRNKFKVASDESKNAPTSPDYSEVIDATNKNSETQNGFPGHNTAHAHYVSADTGAYSEVRDSIFKNNTPNTSYTEIDFAHSGSYKSNTTSSSLTSTSDVNYAKLHEVNRGKQNPYDTISGDNGHANSPKNRRKEGNLKENKPDDEVDTSTTETSNEYFRLHDIKQQEQNPYQVLPDRSSEERPTPASSERLDKAQTGKTNTEYSLAGPVSSDKGDEYSRLHDIQIEIQNPYSG